MELPGRVPAGERIVQGKNALHVLQEQGQSAWIDDISRTLITSGELSALIAQGITGLTSNPAIFRKAMADPTPYHPALYRLIREGRELAEILDDLILTDIRGAAELLLPVYEDARGRDGLVSVEVPPAMADDMEETLREARRIFHALNLPNVMIKIPATPAGIEALQQATAEGIKVTSTVLFSLQHYRQVAQAYLAGLERRVQAGLPVEGIFSTAALYISRVDTAVDAELERRIAAAEGRTCQSELQALRGKAAVANAKLVYAAYREIFSGPRWEALAQAGAVSQRCLWASTGTKNPGERDVRYVEELIGPETINTIPPATIAAFLDHGTVERTLDRRVDEAQAVVARLEQAGISLEEIGQRLQAETMQRFAQAHEELLAALRARCDELLARH